MFKWRDLYISYLNLNSRQDRDIRMKAELERVGLTAVRQEGIATTGWEWNRKPYKKMFNRTRGAIGCMLGQMKIMKTAYELGKGCIVLEDDLVFATDIHERLDYIENFVNTKEPDADLIFLGGTVHVGKGGPWWHGERHEPMLAPYCRCKLKRDAELIGDERMIRVYGMFSTHAYAIPFEKIPLIITLIEDVMENTIGIDFSLIIHQPKLKCFAFMPGSVIQYDNQSSIGTGFTYFSNFSKLGPHWFADKMSDFNPATYDWGEARL